jgi:predicted PurR-regulated permease PerM
MTDNMPVPEKSDHPEITTVQWSRAARYIGAVIFLILLVMLAIFISPIARDLVAALLFAFILDIPIRFFSRRTRLSYNRAAILIYIVLYVLMALLLFIGWRFLVDYLQRVISDISASASSLVSSLEEGGGHLIAGISTQTLAKPLKGMVSILLSVLGIPASAYLHFAVVILNVGFFTFLSNLLVFSAHGARGSLRAWIPESFRREADLLVSLFDRIWGNYLAGMLIFAIVLGAGSVVEFWLLGVPYPAVFGFLTGLICLLPLIGGFLSGLIVFIPCLLLGSTRFTTLDPLVFALIVTLINDIICQVSYNFVALPIIGKLVRLPYWIVLSGVMMGFAFNNILFAFLVIPLFSTIRLVYTYLLAKVIGREPFPNRQAPDATTSGFISQLLLDEIVES